MSSILDDIKQDLGVPKAHKEFDSEILMHINTAFFRLKQLGVGPIEGFFASSNKDKWDDFLDDSESLQAAVRSFTFLNTKLRFDPPANSFVLDSIERQIAQLEWCLEIEE